MDYITVPAYTGSIAEAKKIIFVEDARAGHTRPGQQLETAQRQHGDLCKNIYGKAVMLHTIPQGVGGT
eukprot:1160373-Pelagomonas_calceolata.AAC.7